MAEEKNAEKKCQIEGCKRPYRAKGYCNVHYKSWRNGEFGKTRYKICRKEDCIKPKVRLGLCQEHLDKFRLKKNPVLAGPA